MTADHEIDALVADRYLDALLAAADRRADDAPVDAAIEPGVRNAARVLRRSLVRVHPSFRFEERLAQRLSGLAAAQAAPALAAGSGPVRLTPRPAVLDTVDPLLDAILRGELDPADTDAVDRATPAGPDRRPLIVGGAITSAALSLAGVAFVAWRASRLPARSADRAMPRAARAARARRATTALAGGIGSLGGPA